LPPVCISPSVFDQVNVTEVRPDRLDRFLNDISIHSLD
jgi:hypothetical protein